MARLVYFFMGYLIFCSCLSMGGAQEIQKDTPPVLVLNAENLLTLPTHFRSTNNLKLTLFPSTLSSTGLRNVLMSGSAQFSQLQLITMLSYLPSPIIVVDLRQESHGFINDGLAISWYGYHDWANIHDSLSKVLSTEEGLLQALLAKKTADISQLTKKIMLNPYEVEKETTPWKVLEVSAAFTESQLAKKTNIGYLRLPTTDHRKPLDHTVDTFLMFLKKLPPDTWLHFHCAAGDGRTTTFMTMYDIIKNAKHVSLQDIIARQGFIGPLNLARMPSTKDWSYPLFQERLEFIEKFYQYVLKVGENFDPVWSEWVKKIPEPLSIEKK